MYPEKNREFVNSATENTLHIIYIFIIIIILL